jgi:hypothetical protein
VDFLRDLKPVFSGTASENCPDDGKEKIVAPFLLTLCVVNNIASCKTFSVTSNSVIESASDLRYAGGLAPKKPVRQN